MLKRVAVALALFAAVSGAGYALSVATAQPAAACGQCT